MPHLYSQRRYAAGFTLVELSVVLAVIGLLIGGVLAGKSLLRASGIRATMDELGRYMGAFEQFRSEFNALPGDIANATAYWGSASGDGYNSTCYNLDKTGLPTCNGNGDWQISGTNPVTAVNDGVESYLAWQHLANAGFIAGRYTGRTVNSGGFGTRSGTNSPAGKLGGTTYVAQYFGPVSDASLYFPGDYGHALMFGREAASSNAPTAQFTPEEFFNIDKKLDDGLPGHGRILPLVSTSCNLDASNYSLTTKTISCRGFYLFEAHRE